jgi:hypothetical protein
MESTAKPLVEFLVNAAPWVPAVQTLCWIALISALVFFYREITRKILLALIARIEAGASLSGFGVSLGGVTTQPATSVRPAGIDDSESEMIKPSRSKEDLSNSEMVIRKLQEKYVALISHAANFGAYEFDGMFKFNGYLIGIVFLYIEDCTQGHQTAEQLKKYIPVFISKAPKKLKTMYAIVFTKQFEGDQGIKADIGFAVQASNGRIIAEFFILPKLVAEFEMRSESMD